jgi:hypothetical protein
MSEYILVVGVGSDKYSPTELFLLPLLKIKPYLMNELISLEGYEWSCVYRNPCLCKKRDCYECQEWEKIKHEKENRISRKAWILFNKIAKKYDSKDTTSISIKRVFSYNQ